MAKKPELNGTWVTIDGQHVFIQDNVGGKIKSKKDDEKTKKANLKEIENKPKEEKKKKEKDVIKDKPDDIIDDDEKKYYNPNTGEGPFTEKDMEGSLEREFQYLKPEDYTPYIKEDMVDSYTEKFMKENGIDINDKEEYQRIKDDILENPEYYMEWEDISEAKEHYLDKEGTRESDWMGTSEETPKKDKIDYNKRPDSDIDKDIAKSNKQTEKIEKGQADFDPIEFEKWRVENDPEFEMDDDTARYIYEIDKETGSRSGNAKKTTPKITEEEAQERIESGEFSTDTRPFMSDEEASDRLLKEQEELENNQSTKKEEAEKRIKELKKEKKVDSTGTKAVDRETQKEINKLYLDSHAPIDDKITQERISNGELSKDTRPYMSDEKASDMLLKEQEKLDNQRKQKTTNEIMNDKIKGGVEEAKSKHQNIYMETEADAKSGYKHYNEDIIRAHDNFEKFKGYETFTDDEWNNATKEQQQKMAKDSLVNFFKDNDMDAEEMLDFKDELRNNNFHTETEQIEDAYNETIGKVENAKKANSKSISDNLTRTAYNKYLKEHPRSKITFEDFKKSKKK